MARRGRDMARTRSVHSQPKQHGADKEEAETLLLDLHKQYIRLYYSCIAKRLGVNASYINRVANGEHQSEQLRRALLSELGLMQAAA
jgi:ferredoxin